MRDPLEMKTHHFCKEVFHPRVAALTAIGGCIAGRFCGIPPMHGAIYAVTSRSVAQAAFLINWVVLSKCHDQLFELRLQKNFEKLIFAPLIIMANAYLAFTAGNKVLSLIGKPLIFETAAKVSLISGIAGFLPGLLINGIKNRFLN